MAATAVNNLLVIIAEFFHKILGCPAALSYDNRRIWRSFPNIWLRRGNRI
jgi:hypothetical protein